MKGKAIRKGVFIPAFSCVLIAGAVGLINNQLLISFFKGAFELAYQNLSWLYQWIVLTIVILCVILTFSKVGNIRIGGPDAKPKYGFWSWFAMSLTGGIGASIVSSSISQPITFLQSIWGELDGYGIEPGSSEAVLFALGRSFHEWSVFPYAFYGICSISIAYLCFNKKQPVSLSTLLVPLFGDKVKKRGISSLIDAVNILALALALVGTLGTFIGLTSACAKYVYNIQPTHILMLTVMGVTTILYLLSSLSGVEKGIKFFANLNFRFYMVLTAIVLVLGGSAAFIFNTSTSAIGYWLQNLPLWSLDTGTSGGSALLQWWTIYNWTFWMAFAPVTGVFLAQLTYGHTIRESLIVNWLMPSVFAIIWFSVFGGCAINWQLSGFLDIASVINENGTYAGIWAFIGKLPFAQILIPITLFIMLISFSTSADNSVSAISALCTQNSKIGDEAPSILKILWGVAIGILAYLLMAYAAGTKGNDGVRYMVVAIGSVLSIFIILMIASTVKMFFVDKKTSQKQE